MKYIEGGMKKLLKVVKRVAVSRMVKEGNFI
jgi:hypothetical protein